MKILIGLFIGLSLGLIFSVHAQDLAVEPISKDIIKQASSTAEILIAETAIKPAPKIILDTSKTQVELITEKIQLQDIKIQTDGLVSKYAKLYDGCKNK